jgi:hypothetical protein
MHRENMWTQEMIDLMFFMKDELKATHGWCADALAREYPRGHFTELSVRVQYNRVKKVRDVIH